MKVYWKIQDFAFGLKDFREIFNFQIGLDVEERFDSRQERCLVEIRIENDHVRGETEMAAWMLSSFKFFNGHSSLLTRS